MKLGSESLNKVVDSDFSFTAYDVNGLQKHDIGVVGGYINGECSS